MKLNPGIIIQARRGSSRFPDKVVLPFYNGMSILELLIERFKSNPDYGLVVATTVDPADDLICEICARRGVDFYRGSVNNVLDRFYGASKTFNIDPLIRVCSDNPFLIESSPLELLSSFISTGSDYIGYKLSGNRIGIRTHFGLWAELLTRRAIEKVMDSTAEKIYLEHVSNYLYSNPDKFELSYIDVPEIVYSRDDIRLTVDSESDFELTKTIYRQYKEGQAGDSLHALVKLIDNTPEWKKEMNKSIIQNEK